VEAQTGLKIFRGHCKRTAVAAAATTAEQLYQLLNYLWSAVSAAEDHATYVSATEDQRRPAVPKTKDHKRPALPKAESHSKPALTADENHSRPAVSVLKTQQDSFIKK
jgi:hypothetical protein